MPGPQRTLSKVKARAVLAELRDGKALGIACDTEGIGMSSYYRHIERYPDILEEIKKVLDAQKRTRKELAVQTILSAWAGKRQRGGWSETTPLSLAGLGLGTSTRGNRFEL